MSLRSYDLESRRAHTFGRSSEHGGTFRRIPDDGKRENIQSLFETANVSGEVSYKDDPTRDPGGSAVKEEHEKQFHTHPRRDASWDSFEKASSSTLSLDKAQSSPVTLRSNKKSRSDASDKSKRHSGGLFGYISKSWGKRHSSASDKSPGKHSKPRKKRQGGRHSSSSSEDDHKDARRKEMFEIKTDSENVDYPKEINELDKVLSMVVNSPSRDNQDYNLDKVTAVVVGSPQGGIENPFQHATETAADSTGNGDIKYTKFDSTQSKLDEPDAVNKIKEDDFVHAECHSISDRSDEVVETFQNEEIIDRPVDGGRGDITYEKSNFDSQNASPHPKKTRTKSSSSSSSSSSHKSENEVSPTTDTVPQTSVPELTQKFQLAATVMIDPRQVVDEGMVTYFGPVFLSPRKNEDGKNIKIDVLPGRGRILRSPTPSEIEQITASDNKPSKDAETEQEKEGLTDTHIETTSPGTSTRSTLPVLPYTSVGQVVIGQIQPVGNEEEREDDGANVEEKSEPCEHAIRSGTKSPDVEQCLPSHSVPETLTTDLTQPDALVGDRPVPKKREAPVKISDAEKDKGKEELSSSSSSSSSESDNEEKANHQGVDDIHKTEEKEEFPSADDAVTQSLSGTGISVHITPHDQTTNVHEPTIQKYFVKTPESGHRVLDLSQAVKIPLVSIGSLQVEGATLDNVEESIDLNKASDLPTEKADLIFESDQLQRQDVLEDKVVCCQSFVPEVRVPSPIFEITPIESRTSVNKLDELDIKDDRNLDQDNLQTPTGDRYKAPNPRILNQTEAQDLKKEDKTEFEVYRSENETKPGPNEAVENLEFPVQTGVDMEVGVPIVDEVKDAQAEESYDPKKENDEYSVSDKHNESKNSDKSGSSSSSSDGVTPHHREESFTEQNKTPLQSANILSGTDNIGNTGVNDNQVTSNLIKVNGEPIKSCEDKVDVCNMKINSEHEESIPNPEPNKATLEVMNEIGQPIDIEPERQIEVLSQQDDVNRSVSSTSSSSGESEEGQTNDKVESPTIDICICQPDQIEPCENEGWQAVKEAFDNATGFCSSSAEETKDKELSNELNKSGSSPTTTSDEGKSADASLDNEMVIDRDSITSAPLEDVDNKTINFSAQETDSPESSDTKSEKVVFEERNVDGYLPEHSDKMVLEESVSPFQPPLVGQMEQKCELSLSLNPTILEDSALEKPSDDLTENENNKDKVVEKKKEAKERGEKRRKTPQKTKENIRDNSSKDEQADEINSKRRTDEESDTQGKCDTTVDTSTTSSGDSSGSRKQRAHNFFMWPFKKHKKKSKESDTSKHETDNADINDSKVDEPVETKQTIPPENASPRTSTPLNGSSVSASDAYTSDCPSPKVQSRSVTSDSDKSSVSRQSSKQHSPIRKSSSSSSSSEVSTPHASRPHSPAVEEYDATHDKTKSRNEGQAPLQTSVISSVVSSDTDKRDSREDELRKRSKSSSVDSHTTASEDRTTENFEESLRSIPTPSADEKKKSSGQTRSKPKEKKSKKRDSYDTSIASGVHASQLDSSIASDAHSQEIKEKKKRKAHDDKTKKKNKSEDQKADTAESKVKQDETPKADLQKEKRGISKKTRTDKKDKLEKNRSQGAIEIEKPLAGPEKVKMETKRTDRAKSPSAEDKILSKEKSHKGNKDLKSREDSVKPPDNVLKKEKVRSQKQKPVEKPARRKLKKSSDELQESKSQSPKSSKKDKGKSSNDSSSSSSASDEEIEKEKIREIFGPSKETSPVKENNLQSEAVEMTSAVPPLKSAGMSNRGQEIGSPQPQNDPSYRAEPVRPPRTPKSQKQGKFHKLLPSIRSPSAKDEDKKFDKFEESAPKFDGQYHREDDVTHDVYEETPKPEVYTSSPRVDEPEYSEPRHFVVVAIDFGTTHSGYAFSFTRDPSSVYMMRRWAGEEPGVVNQKTLTSLLLNPEGEFHSFGYSARSNYLNLVPLEARHWLYFSTFKMELHHNSELNRDTQLVASNGVKFSALRVFAHSLNFFKTHALQQLSDQAGTELMDEDIRWVITVPAIWKPPAKQFMRQAAYEAGLANPSFPEQLLIALEPEAASIYCRRLRMHQLVPEQPIVRPLQSPRSASTELVNQEPAVTDLTVGSRYLIVDCGGGTVDITVHELDPSGHITELHRATGGPFGSIGVDTEFERLLCGIFGIEFVEHYKKKYPMGWVHLMTDFESRKRSASPFKSTSLNVSPPFTFINDFKKHKYDPEVAVKKYGDSEVEWSPQGMLRLTPAAMKRLFLPTVTHIKQAVGDVLNHPNARGLRYLFLVGGFAESPILQHEMRQEFGHLIKLLIPQEVSLAILKGAVLFGVDPSIVNVRRSRLTYGVGILNRFDAKKHPAPKRVRRDGVDWCTDILDKYVETDQPVMLGNSVVRSYTPAKTGQLSIVLNVYSSHNPNVRFITDPGVIRCGTLCLTLPVLDSDVGGGASGGHVRRQAPPPPREIQARMSFGDTEINVVAIDMVTGKLVKASIDFLGR